MSTFAQDVQKRAMEKIAALTKTAGVGQDLSHVMLGRPWLDPEEGQNIEMLNRGIGATYGGLGGAIGGGFLRGGKGALLGGLAGSGLGSRALGALGALGLKGSNFVGGMIPRVPAGTGL